MDASAPACRRVRTLDRFAALSGRDFLESRHSGRSIPMRSSWRRPRRKIMARTATESRMTTAAFQNAMNAVYNSGGEGGGVVWVPAGTYLFNGNLTIPTGVTLRGDWQDWTTGTGGIKGTTFKITAGAARGAARRSSQ